MVFAGGQKLSANCFAALAERTFVVSSFGKTFHVTGWKLGYCVAPAALSTEFRKIHQYLVFSCNAPMQYAIAEYMKEKTHYRQLKNLYQAKRNFFIERIKSSRFSFVPAQGTYFQLVNFNGVFEEKDTELAIRLTKEFKLASIPLSVFYHEKTDNKLLRFCFAKKEETLEKAAELICKM